MRVAFFSQTLWALAAAQTLDWSSIPHPDSVASHDTAATRHGRTRPTFQTPKGYDKQLDLGTATIDAPDNCNGECTFLQQDFFPNVRFTEPERCAAACTNTAGCYFFNTYILLQDGKSVGQNCMLYSQTWGAKYKRTEGYRFDGHHYTAQMSVAYSNAKHPGYCSKNSTMTPTTSSVSSSAPISSLPITSSTISSSSSIVSPITTSDNCSSTITLSTSTSDNCSSTVSPTTTSTSCSETTSSISSSTSTSCTDEITSSSTSCTTSSTSVTPVHNDTTSSPIVSPVITSSTGGGNLTSTAPPIISKSLPAGNSSTTPSITPSISANTSITSSVGPITTTTPISLNGTAITNSTTVYPAGVTDTLQSVPPTITPTIALPTTTNISAIMPSPTHVMNFQHDNSDDTQFMYSSNITAINGTTVVNVETFMPFVAGAQCSPSQIIIAFTTLDAFDLAQSTWPNTFTLMTSSAAVCGQSATGRTFYKVSSVSFDQSVLTATLAVSVTDMSTVIYRVQAEWGTSNVTSSSNGTSSSKKARDLKNSGSTGFWLDTNAFTNFAQDFIQGFNAGYNLLVNLDVSDFESELNPEAPVDNRVQCPGCGLSAYISLYGNYDISGLSMASCHVGFSVQNANLNVAFEVFGVAGYSISETFGLDTIDLPGISVADVLTVSPTVAMQAEVDFTLVSGGLNIANLGVGWTATEDLNFDLDLVNDQTSQSGWDQNLIPQFLSPLFENIPSELDFRGSIGPVFGIELTIGLGAIHIFDASASIGMDTPYIDMDFTGLYSGGTSSCVDYTGEQDPSKPPQALGLTVTTGIDIYAELSLDLLSLVNEDTGRLPILGLDWTIYEGCWLLDADAIDNTEWAPGFD